MYKALDRTPLDDEDFNVYLRYKMYKSLDKSPLDEALEELNESDEDRSDRSSHKHEEKQELIPKNQPAIIDNLQELCAKVIRPQFFDILSNLKDKWVGECIDAERAFRKQRGYFIHLFNLHSFVNPCLYPVLKLSDMEIQFNEEHLNEYIKKEADNHIENEKAYDNHIKRWHNHAFGKHGRVQDHDFTYKSRFEDVKNHLSKICRTHQIIYETFNA